MKKVYLMSDYSNKCKKIAEDLCLPKTNIISIQTHENDRAYHNWLNKEFKENEIDKILIPISISNDFSINTDGLLFGLHIRLNYELPLKKRLIPIIFLSNFTLENLFKNNQFDIYNNPQYLLLTRGVYLSSFDIEEIKNTVEIVTAFSDSEYYKNVLPKLNIHRLYGGHDIANAWGCFKLAQVLGISDKIFELNSISKHLKQLYAKYLICYNESFNREKRIDLEPLNCSGKKILFIDDKSDEGWAYLMQNIFKSTGNNFVFVDSSKYKADDEHKSFNDYEGFLNECRSHIGKDWDLIIIDLRLNPEKEDIDNEMISPTEFSGYKLIVEFLTENEGYQIIVSTASNKIWNINAALERGASSYYVKESPEFNYSISETNKHYENFKKVVENCFEQKYLFNIWECINKIKKHFDYNPLKKYFPNNLKMLEALSYQILILEELDSSFRMLKTDNKNKLNVAMLSIFKTLESLSEIFISKSETSGKLHFYDNLEVKFCDSKFEYEPKSKTSEISKNAYESTENKIHALLSQKLGIKDLSLHEFIRNISKYRNNYIHPKNRFILKKLTSKDIENWFASLHKILIKV